jgi:dihydrofolate reductase
MGGPWTYADDGRDTDGMHGADREYYESITDGLGCGIVGRNMYDAAGAWGGRNPFPGTWIVLTHRTEDQPDPSAGFLFVDGFNAALMKARELAGDGGVSLGGGADLIRQGLAAGVVDELAISTAPLVLGGGKRLFEGFEQDLDLEMPSVAFGQRRWAGRSPPNSWARPSSQLWRTFDPQRGQSGRLCRRASWLPTRHRPQRRRRRRRTGRSFPGMEPDGGPRRRRAHLH